jgi:outer membrane lipase/esterase
MQWRLIIGGLACCLPAVSCVHAAETDVGDVLEQLGAPQFLVRAGDAVRATCLELADAASTLTAPQLELFDRCREMAGTVLDGANSFGYDDIGDALNALQQLAGEEVSSQGRLVTEGSNRQFADVGVRMDAIRRGARGIGSGVAFNLHGHELGRAFTAHMPQRTPAGSGASADRDADTGWGWFGTANIGFGDRDHTRNESG